MTHRQPRPLIGIACNSQRSNPWVETGKTHSRDGVNRPYVRAVEGAGGLPVLVPRLADLSLLAELVSRLDGLILSGGPDITPRCYGEEPRPGLQATDYALDLFQIELARRAEAIGLPILGICRGLQVLTVTFGGSLIQDIKSQVAGCLEHASTADLEVLTHRVSLVRPSLLYDILGTENLWVNSHHHQAAKTLPAGFLVTARASDGVIEAIERPDYPFLLGVQWHPEGSAEHDQPSQKLFAALVAAAKSRA